MKLRPLAVAPLTPCVYDFTSKCVPQLEGIKKQVEMAQTQNVICMSQCGGI